LIELKQLANGLGVAPPRRVQQFSALIHLLFFGMGSRSSFHANPFFASACAVDNPDRRDSVRKAGEVYQNQEEIWNLSSELIVP
jgi:hypothetical protein